VCVCLLACWASRTNSVHSIRLDYIAFCSISQRRPNIQGPFNENENGTQLVELTQFGPEFEWEKMMMMIDIDYH